MCDNTKQKTSHRAQFEYDLTQKTGTELLDTWDMYISYMEQEHRNKLRDRIKLMRRCVLHYRKSTEFNQSVKFVKIWLKLAAAMDEPKLIYESMKERKIGSSLAIFYRDWAEYCAHNGFQDEVEKIFDLGKMCNAGPTNILQNCRDELLKLKQKSQDKGKLFEQRGAKVKRSHLYYDPNNLSEPGTVVKYHKASIYSQPYELSFEELKAKLPQYSSNSKINKDIKVLVCDDMRDSKCKDTKIDDSIGAEDNCSDVPVVEEKLETCLNSSHSFIDDFIADNIQPEEYRVEHFEGVLEDLNVTGNHCVPVKDKGGNLPQLQLSEVISLFSHKQEEQQSDITKMESNSINSNNCMEENASELVQQSYQKEPVEDENSNSSTAILSTKEGNISNEKSTHKMFENNVTTGKGNLSTQNIRNMLTESFDLEEGSSDEISPQLLDENFEKLPVQIFRDPSENKCEIKCEVPNMEIKKINKPSKRRRTLGGNARRKSEVPIIQEKMEGQSPKNSGNDSDLSCQNLMKSAFSKVIDEAQQIAINDEHLLADRNNTKTTPSVGRKNILSNSGLAARTPIIGKGNDKILESTLSSTPGMTTVTQNIRNMFSETCDFGNESNGAISDKLRDENFQNPPLKGFEIFKDGLKEDIEQSENAEVINNTEPKPLQKFEIFKDECDTSNSDELEKGNKIAPREMAAITPGKGNIKNKNSDNTINATPGTVTSYTQNIRNMFSETCELGDNSAESISSEALVDERFEKLPLKKFEIFKDVSGDGIEISRRNKDDILHTGVKAGVTENMNKNEVSVTRDKVEKSLENTLSCTPGMTVDVRSMFSETCDLINEEISSEKPKQRFLIFKDDCESSEREKKFEKDNKAVLSEIITATPGREFKEKNLENTIMATPGTITACTQNIRNMFSETFDLGKTSPPMPGFKVYTDPPKTKECEEVKKQEFMIYKDTPVQKKETSSAFGKLGKLPSVPSIPFPKSNTAEEKQSNIKLDLDITSTPGVPRYESTAYFGAGKKHIGNTPTTTTTTKSRNNGGGNLKNCLKDLANDSFDSPNLGEFTERPRFLIKDCKKDDGISDTPVGSKQCLAGVDDSCKGITDIKSTDPLLGRQEKENISIQKIEQIRNLADFSDFDASPSSEDLGNADIFQPGSKNVKRKEQFKDLFDFPGDVKKGRIETGIREDKADFASNLLELENKQNIKESEIRKQKRILAELSNLDDADEKDFNPDIFLTNKTQQESKSGMDQLGNSIFNVSQKLSAKAGFASLICSPLLKEDDLGFTSLSKNDKFEEMFAKDSKAEIPSMIQGKRSFEGITTSNVWKKVNGPATSTFLNPSMNTKERFELTDCTLGNMTDHRKRSISDSDNEGSKQPVKRFISTPSSPGRKHCITFDQQVSQILPAVTFEKTQNTHLYEDEAANLSPIAELSNEDSKGGNDQTNGPGEASNVTQFSKLSKVDPFVMDNNNLALFVQKVLPVVEKFDNFQQIVGPLPKLQGATMSLNIGTRSIRICKCIEKQEYSAIYSALYQGREEITIKCIEKAHKLYNQCVWDVYIGNEIHQRINLFSKEDFLLNQDYSLLENFLKHNQVCVYNDSIYVESKSFHSGTILDTIALYKNHQCMLDEALALLYTYEILNIIHTLHKIDILHGNLNPKVLSQKNTSSMTNSNAIATRLITLNDFSTSIDLRLIDQKKMIVGTFDSILYPCPEMREGKPWKYNVDYYAGAATIYFLIFQSDMDTSANLNNVLSSIKSKISSAWNLNLWVEVFKTLLIHSSIDQTNMVPVISRVGAKLIHPDTIECVKQAHLKTYDLCMMDDEDDDTDEDDD